MPVVRLSQGGTATQLPPQIPDSTFSSHKIRVSTGTARDLTQQSSMRPPSPVEEAGGMLAVEVPGSSVDLGNVAFASVNAQKHQNTFVDFKKAVMEPMEDYLFMNPEHRRIKGLSKWSTEEWTAHLDQHHQAAGALVSGIFDQEDEKGANPGPQKAVRLGEDTIYLSALADGKAGELTVDLEALADGKLGEAELRTLAAHIRQRLSRASKVPEWKAVLQFQHRVANTEAHEGIGGRGAPDHSAFGAFIYTVPPTARPNQSSFEITHNGRKGRVLVPPGQTVEPGKTELHIEIPEPEDPKYLDPALLSQMMFDREFPLGVEANVLRGDNALEFAIRHSGGGSHRVQHQENKCVTRLPYLAMVAVTLFALCYTFYRMYGDMAVWSLEATIQDPSRAASRVVAENVKYFSSTGAPTWD